LLNGSRWVAAHKVTEYQFRYTMIHPKSLQPLEEGEEFSGSIVPTYTTTESMREAA